MANMNDINLSASDDYSAILYRKRLFEQINNLARSKKSSMSYDELEALEKQLINKKIDGEEQITRILQAREKSLSEERKKLSAEEILYRSRRTVEAEKQALSDLHKERLAKEQELATLKNATGTDEYNKIKASYDLIFEKEQALSKSHEETIKADHLLQLEKQDQDDKWSKKRFKLEKQLLDARLKLDGSTMDQRRRAMEEYRVAEKKLEVEKARENNYKNSVIGQFTTSIDSSKGGSALTVLNLIASKLDNLGDKAFKSVEDNLIKYQSQMDARLQGTTRDYTSMTGRLTKVMESYPVTTATTVISKLNDLVSQGISYNVEQRAFIASIADEVVSSFEALRPSLLQIVRLQREDSTSARLGLQSVLQTFLNTNYEDSAYLRDSFNGVANSLADAEMMMSAQSAAEFEFVVQKWLGSMYETGFSGNTVNTIASAINKLATGDVNGLGDAERNLLAMSASRSGMDLAQLLTGGLTADTTNILLKSMVEYLSEISDNTGKNNVVAKQYSQIFGFQITDLQAAKNIRDQINSIYSSNLSYAGMQQEANYQSGQGIISRTPTAKLINNIVDNYLYGAATNIVNNPAMYATYKISNFAEKLVGENIVTSVLKAGLFGANLVSDIMSGFNTTSNALFSNISSQFGKGNVQVNGSPLQAIGTELTMRGALDTLSPGSGMSSSIIITRDGSVMALPANTLNGNAEKISNTYKSIAGIDTNSISEYTVSDIYNQLFRDTNPGQLTVVRDSVSNLAERMTTAISEETGALRVNIEGISDNISGSIPIKLGGWHGTGWIQANRLLTDHNKDVQDKLGYILTLLSNMATSDGNAMDINIVGSDISAQSLASGTATYKIPERGTYADYTKMGSLI